MVRRTRNDDDDPLAARSADVAAFFEAFREQQRLLASRMSEITAFPPLKIAEVHDALARSVDFGALTRLSDSIGLPALATDALTAVADDLAKSIDLGAITEANRLIVENALATAVPQEQLERTKALMEQFSLPVASEQISKLFASVDLSELLAPAWLPDNIADADLDAVAAISLDDGVPIAWVPRAEIVAELIAAGSREEREEILLARCMDVLDDCEAVLAEITHELAAQCRYAIDAARVDLYAPAQSHAAGIVESVTGYGIGGRERAKARAAVAVDDLPLRFACEHFVIRPLLRCFIEWYPSQGRPIPDHFSRHATAHAVGKPDVFTPINSLVAVMLATSLTVQYWEGL